MQPPIRTTSALRRWVWSSVVACGLTLAACARSGGDGARPVDLDGRPFDLSQGAPSTTVVVFVATKCPISNRYAPEVRRLRDEFAPRGVRFLVVYPDGREPVDAIREHVAEYQLPSDVVRDPGHTLVARVGVSVTPEVAVLSREGDVIYRGRIDDRQVDFGKARAEPTRRDLELALVSVLEGRPVETRATQAIGCGIGPAR